MAPIPNLSINPFIFSAFFPRVAVFEISAAYVGVILPRALSMAAPMPSYSAEKLLFATQFGPMSRFSTS